MDFSLAPHPLIQRGPPLLLVILDGVGLGSGDDYDAVAVAQTPTLDALFTEGPRYCTLAAHGHAVGLPSDKDMGNSEVGHNALGSGRVVTQGAGLVDNDLRSGAIFKSQGYEDLQCAFSSGHTLHLIGLLSDGGIHSRFDQLEGIIAGSVARGAKKIRLHILTDGRDVPDETAGKFIAQLEQVLVATGVDAKIASGGGRMMVTMDRYEADWSIVERGYLAHVHGRGRAFASAQEAVRTFREEDPTLSDQTFPPFVIHDAEGPVGKIVDGDAVLCFNFRGDRVLEISRAFTEKDFAPFDRQGAPDVVYAGMMEYDGDLKIPARTLVEPPAISETAGEYLAHNGIRSFVCSETQKFGHVTYFWNGNRSGKFDDALETYQEIPSDRIAFNERPEMKAMEIAHAACVALKSGKHDFVRINIANGDMVGHTGDLAATVRALETVDRALKLLLDTVRQVKGRYLVTADHGNADDMAIRDKSGAPKFREGHVVARTSHTLARVGCAVGGEGLERVEFRPQKFPLGLANTAATHIELLGLAAPSDYEVSLFGR